MKYISTDGLVVSEQFSNYDELAESVKGWDLDFCQLDAGDSPTEIFQCHTRHTQLSAASLSRQYHQSGSSPSGLTFAFLDEHVKQLNWLNRNVDDASLLVYRDQGEIDCVSSPDFRVYTLTYDAEMLQQLEDRLQTASQTRKLTRASAALDVDQNRIRRIRHHLKHLVSHLQQHPDALSQMGLRKELEDEIPRRIIHLLGGGDHRDPIASPRVRSQALNRALEVIDASGHEGISIGELCQHCGVSDRTLEHAFRDHFGKTPAAYIKARRLHKVRSRLKELRGTDTRITDVANGWGFWHMGQFAADYRRFFGELPSETANGLRASPGMHR
jgi:AraC-like DNA-binding protein